MNDQYCSDDEEYFDARSHCTRSDASFRTANTAMTKTASMASRTRSRLNEVAILSELEGFEELRLVKDIEASFEAVVPSTPAPADQELPPTPNPPFLNALYVEAEDQERNLETSVVQEADGNPLFEAVDLPLPPPRSSWNRTTISPSGSEQKQNSIKRSTSDVESLQRDQHDSNRPVITSPPESRAYRTVSGLVDKMIGSDLRTVPAAPAPAPAPAMPEFSTPKRTSKVAEVVVISEDSPQIMISDVSTPKVTPIDQSLMQAAKNSNGRKPVTKLRSPSPALSFPSPHCHGKPPPLILPSASTTNGIKSPSPTAQSPVVVRKATVVVGQRFMVEGTPTPGSRSKPVRSSVKSILSSCFYPHEADKWEVGPPTGIECQQYVVTYES